MYLLFSLSLLSVSLVLERLGLSLEGDQNVRDKYQNKTTFWRFFHKYTGFITVAILAPIIITAWLIYDDSQVFFENWSCGMIYDMETIGLNFEETKRHAEIIQECNERPIQFQTDRPTP